MSINDEKEWGEFRAALLNSKFNGAPSEAELVERLKAMLTRCNVFALRAASSAKLINDPGGKFWPDQFWAKGAIYTLSEYQTPYETGPSGTG